MIITTEQLKEIVAAGGGLTIDASAFTFNQMKEICGANVKNAKITIKNLSGLTHNQLKELAAQTPGVLAFDITG